MSGSHVSLYLAWKPNEFVDASGCDTRKLSGSVVLISDPVLPGPQLETDGQTSIMLVRKREPRPDALRTVAAATVAVVVAVVFVVAP